MYPNNLTYYVSALKNFSRNTFKLLPYRTDDVRSNQIIVLELPPAALIDPATLTMHALGSTTASGGTNNFAGFPKHIETLISRCVVELNGQAIQSCNNLEHVTNILMSLQNGYDFQSKRKAYANGGDQVSPTALASSQPLKIQHFPGFLSSVRPGIIDTSLLGSVRIHIYLAPSSVLIAPTSGPATSVDYSLSSLYFTVDTLSIDDGTFYKLHGTYLGSGSSYSLLFDNYYTALFSAATPSQSSRFSVSTQSLDMVMACFLPNHGVLSGVNASTGQSAYFDRKGDGVTSWNFTINNCQYPQYQASADDAFPLLLNALNKTADTVGGIDPLISTATAWKTHWWVAGQGFSFAADNTDRLISGLDTRGQNATIAFQSVGTGTTTNLMIIAKCTSEIRVSAGKQLEIIQ